MTGMVCELRHFRYDFHTINGLQAYKLIVGNSNNYISAYISGAGDVTVYVGIRVWKRNSGGGETEITAGTPVAVVSRPNAGEGQQSNTWSCPQTSLATTDAIVVRAYIKIGTGAWTLGADAVLNSVFITEQLGETQLDAGVWTITYFTEKEYSSKDDITTGYFWWGSSDKESKIANFCYSTPAPPPTETIVAKEFPMAYLEKPVAAKELTSKVENPTVSSVSKDFPEKLLKKGKAKELRSKWE